MIRLDIAIYYAHEYGVIFVDDIPPAGENIPIPLNPVGYTMDKVSPKLMGETVLERMARIDKTPSVNKEDSREYWKISGIKGFKKFSVTFSNVLVSWDNEWIHIEQMKTPPKTGGYALDRSKPTIDLPIEIEPEALGETLLSVLRSLEPKEQNTGYETIETVGGNKLIFKTPGDDFEDYGDGHTDAYKVYCHSNSDETTSSFMIDSGYKGYDASSVREKWEQWYGEIDSFTYDQVDGKTIIRASTGETELISYLYHRGEETIELLTTIDKKVFAGQELVKVRKELEDMAKSVVILSKTEGKQ